MRTLKTICSCGLVAVHLIAGAAISTANGGYGGTITITNTTVPNPASNSGTTSGGGAWEFSITGTGGSFAGKAKAEDTNADGINAAFGDCDTGLKSATGSVSKSIGDWTPGTCTYDGQSYPGHGAPSDAKVTGAGNGTATARLDLNANNGVFSFTDLGVASGFAYAHVGFSGTSSGGAGPHSCTVTLAGTLSEGDTTISGTLSADPSVTITHTVSSDVGIAYGANSCSPSFQTVGVIAGANETGYGAVTVSASNYKGARKAAAEANTTLTVTITKNYGGSELDCNKRRHDH